MALTPVGIGHDRLAPDLIEGDILGRMAGRGGNGHGGEDLIGRLRGPFECLHPAHGAADHAEQAVDAERLDKGALGADHVGNGDDGKTRPIGLAIGGLGRRAGCAHTAAEYIGRNDMEPVGIDSLARPDDTRPPSGTARDRVGRACKLIARQRVADKNDIGPVLIQRAPALIGDIDMFEGLAAIELQRLWQGEHAQGIGLGRSIIGHRRSGVGKARSSQAGSDGSPIGACRNSPAADTLAG